MQSADDALQGAVDALLQKLTSQEEIVRDTKKTVNTLLHHMGKEPMFTDVDDTAKVRASLTIRPDQFYGKPLATVAKAVLELRGQAMTATDIIKVLEEGGYDFDSQGWKEKDRLRAFTITLAKNNLAFHRLPNGHFGLPVWYPEAMKKKSVQKAEKDAAIDVEESLPTEDIEKEG